MNSTPKHIVIDGRIRRSSTGRPVDRLLHYLPLIDQHNKYTVLIEDNDPLTFKEANFRTKKVIFKQFSFNPTLQLKFSYLIYKLRPNLVFFTMTGQAPLFYFGKNVTLTHDLTMLRFARPGRLPKWLHQIRMAGYRILFWKGNHSADLIFTPTRFVEKDLISNYPFTKGKTTVTYEAGNEPLKTPAKGVNSVNQPFIFHVGSPFPHKNIQNLVRAFELAKNQHPKLQLVLSGKKEFYFTELESWIKNREFEKDIFITGYVSDAELKWLYQNAEAYVLPSLSEGFGLPGLEAMANNCPVICSKTSCMPEVYGDAATYFDPENIHDIAENIGKVLNSPKLKQELVKKGQKQITKYSWDKMVKEMHEAYTKLLA